MMTDERITELWDSHVQSWRLTGKTLINPVVFARLIEAEVTKPKSAAECAVGKCDCDPHIEICDQCVPSAFNKATKPQEPVAWIDKSGFPRHISYLQSMSERKLYGPLTPLYTTPQLCPVIPEGMALVTKEDGENYCRILSLLGMEEEGSPVLEVERLIALRDGLVCGDCNDTGWLENREEGRHPCTCMTEAEPYQLLEAERDALAMQNQKMRELLDDVPYIIENGMLNKAMRLVNEALALALPDHSEIIKQHDAEAK